MLVRFLPKSNQFLAVIYNFDKQHDGNAVLLEASNFNMLDSLRIQRPEDYVNYFLWLASLNHRIKNAQLHAVISAQGQTKSPAELHLIAKQWLKEMNYAQQPYLIFFHSDTINHHVHIVSCRVRKDGTVISNSFDRIKSIEALARISGKSIQQIFTADLQEALCYTFPSRAAFKVLLERKRYYLGEDETGFKIYKYRRMMAKVSFSELDKLIASKEVDPLQQHRIKEIILAATAQQQRKAMPVFDNLVGGRKGRLTGYRSQLSIYLENNHALQTIYLSADNGKVNDYFIVDPLNKQILDSSMILSPLYFLGAETEGLGAGITAAREKEFEEFSGYSNLAGFNISISEDVDDASVYHKKNRKT